LLCFPTLAPGLCLVLQGIQRYGFAGKASKLTASGGLAGRTPWPFHATQIAVGSDNDIIV
jgi:hypothetical protein